MGLLSLESAIVARLTDLLGDAVHILTESTMDLDKGRLRSPAVYVIFLGGDPVADDYQHIAISQQWGAVVAVRNVASPDGAGARAEADAISDRVIAALQGWQPAGATLPLSMIRTPAPDYVDGFLTLSTVYQTGIEIDLS